MRLDTAKLKTENNKKIIFLLSIIVQHCSLAKITVHWHNILDLKKKKNAQNANAAALPKRTLSIRSTASSDYV